MSRNPSVDENFISLPKSTKSEIVIIKNRLMEFEVSKKGMLYFTSLIKTNVEIFDFLYFCNEHAHSSPSHLQEKTGGTSRLLGLSRIFFSPSFLLNETVSFIIWL